MTSRVLVVPALAIALVTLGSQATARATAPVTARSPAPAAAARQTAKAPKATVDVPAYAGGHRLRARLPAGGVVSFRLSRLPAHGHRLLGDWNGDGVPTPATFAGGHWRLHRSVVRPGGHVVRVTFGRAGSRPVVGDWNGDGVTDLGVVRGRTWSLALGPFPDKASAATPAVWRRFRFGPRGGTPLAGDWNGNGVSGIASVKGRRWVLASSARGGARRRSVSYGGRRGVPVVGDWNGDGRDGIGRVRRSTWHLSNRTVRPRTASRIVLKGRSGATPVAWQVARARGAVCPTRVAARSLAPSRWVVPSPLLDRDAAATVDHTGDLVRGSLVQTERYLLGAQYHTRWAPTHAQPYLGLLGRTGDELAIRLPAMSALTVAVGLRLGAYDQPTIGRGRAFATAYVDHLVRSIACSHEAVSPGGWGLGWETAHWAMLAGAAAWLEWDRLDPQTRADVTTMVVAEADHQLALRVPYWHSPDGTPITPGDTKAEEDAWNAGLLALAAAMMPSAPHAPQWRAKAAELGVAAYAVRADDTSTTVVNGVPLSQRLKGYNAYDDGTVENHHIIHPDYASAVQLLWLAADFDRLARQRVPEAMFHNGGLVYSALSTVGYTAGAPSPAGGTFDAPGGTVYQPGSSSIYYPQGDDWGTARRAHFVSLDAHALVYAPYLGASGWPAGDALLAHERGQRHLWASSGAHDGRTYSVDPSVAARQDTYPGREEYAAQNLATAWLALYVGQLGLPGLDTGTLQVPHATRPAAKAPAASAHVAP